MEPITLTGFMGMLLAWLLVLVAKDLLLILADYLVDFLVDLGKILGDLAGGLGTILSKLIK